MKISLKGTLAGNESTETMGKGTIANLNAIYPTTQGCKRVNFRTFPRNEGGMIVVVVGDGCHGSHLECGRVGVQRNSHPTDLI
jgi:hypothetical protein